MGDMQGENSKRSDTDLIAILIGGRLDDMYVERHGNVVIIEGEGTDDRYVVTVTKQLMFGTNASGGFFDEARQPSDEAP